jgi:thiamine biosynthesis lipoprotein
MLMVSVGIAQASAAKTPASLIQQEAHLMGTRFHITVADEGDPNLIARTMNEALSEVARIEAIMSEWRSDSELSRINAQAGVAPVAVSQETIQLLQKALALSSASNGAFDPTWAALRGIWDFKKKPPTLPARTKLVEALARVGAQYVKIDPSKSTVFLTKSGMALGLGAIAKGYAIDRAADILRKNGLKNFIVDGGGDLYLAGKKPTGQWTIGIRHPRKSSLLAELSISDRAVVSSGDYERYFQMGDRRYHHIIDLNTGMPATRSVAVTVIAPNATLADALATAIFILGPEKGHELAKGYPDVDFISLTPNGEIYTSASFEEKIPARWNAGR